MLGTQRESPFVLTSPPSGRHAPPPPPRFPPSVMGVSGETLSRLRATSACGPWEPAALGSRPLCRHPGGVLEAAPSAGGHLGPHTQTLNRQSVDRDDKIGGGAACSLPYSEPLPPIRPRVAGVAGGGDHWPGCDGPGSQSCPSSHWLVTAPLWASVPGSGRERLGWMPSGTTPNPRRQGRRC